VRWPGCVRGAITAALIFLLHFLHQGKKWKKKEKQRSDSIVHYSTIKFMQYLINLIFAAQKTTNGANGF